MGITATLDDIDTNHNPTDWVNIISAGVDCVGLTQGSASYIDNNYVWQDIFFSSEDDERAGLSRQDLGYDPSGENSDVNWYLNNSPYERAFPLYDVNDPDYSWRITWRDNEDSNGNLLNLEKIIPGDIMYYLGNPGHVAMILSIEYDGNSRATTPAEIRLIESTYDPDGDFAKVINFRTLENYIDPNWNIVRLNTNN